MLLLIVSNIAAQTAASECPSSQFTAWGATGVVTPGSSNRLRDKASTDGAVIGQLPAGQPFNVVYRRATCADGYLWIEIQTVSQRGWTVERPIDGDAFVVPYDDPEPREIGARLEDGTYFIDESGLRMEIPAWLNVEQVLIETQIGLFGDVMIAQPSSVVLTFRMERGLGRFRIFPYAITDAIYESYWSDDLITLLTEQPSLSEYAARNRMPQAPIGGVAALFGGAGIYLPFNNGVGLRYLTYFAQDDVLFDADDTLTYVYRGLTNDHAFLIEADRAGIAIPPGTILSNGSRNSDGAYSRYLRQFEANLSALPTDAFTPDLARIDALLSTLSITNNAALMDLIP